MAQGNCPSWVKFPKGITLEKMIADNLPDIGLTLEERIMQTMANLSTAYADDLDSLRIPFIEDPALSGGNLAAKYQHFDFAQFVDKLNEHLTLLAENGTDNNTWKAILGDNFPAGGASTNSRSLAKTIRQDIALKASHRQNSAIHCKRQSQTQPSRCLPERRSISLMTDPPYRRDPQWYTRLTVAPLRTDLSSGRSRTPERKPCAFAVEAGSRFLTRGRLRGARRQRTRASTTCSVSWCEEAIACAGATRSSLTWNRKSPWTIHPQLLKPS